MLKPDDDLAAEIRRTCSHGDWEIAHGEADKLIVQQLRALGYNKTADAWDAVGKWYA
jgi:hypothetical protein